MSLRAIVLFCVAVTGDCVSAVAAPVHVFGGPFNLRIPADPDSTKGWMADAIIEVPEHLTISDLDIGITITHTKVFDLQIFLKSPSGTRVLLNMYDPFTEYFEGQNYEQTIFDDEASVPIEEGRPPFTGRFRPRQPSSLSAFDGQDAYGFWRLQIYDAYYADAGWLKNCELFITVPEPASAAFFLLAVTLLRLRKSVRTF